MNVSYLTCVEEEGEIMDRLDMMMWCLVVVLFMFILLSLFFTKCGVEEEDTDSGQEEVGIISM